MDVLVDFHGMRRQMGFAANLLRRRPFQCLLQVTNRCNMKCSFCDFWPNGALPHEELTIDEFRRLAGQLSNLGRFLVSIEGGEPFVRPDLTAIVGAFADDHIPLLFTNGWYVTPAAARELFAAGLAQVGVSIDYPDAARHDSQRGLAGAFGRAWHAVDAFRDAAPHGQRQVHVMTVLMEDNWRDLDALLEMSAARGVGHSVTLLSPNGFRRAPGQRLPAAQLSGELVALWRKHSHFRTFRDYLARIDTFLTADTMPTCRAGIQSFNIDHVGNVSTCIEKIDSVAGNMRQEPLAAIHERLVQRDEAATCQACWTACRGFSQALGGGGTPGTWWDLVTRMRSA
jgi:MoaA/NifB/PqqE/SkfB family radical SAM enzyme